MSKMNVHINSLHYFMFETVCANDISIIIKGSQRLMTIEINFCSQILLWIIILNFYFLGWYPLTFKIVCKAEKLRTNQPFIFECNQRFIWFAK